MDPGRLTGVDVGEGEDGVLVLLESSLNLLKRRPSSHGRADLSDLCSVSLKAVGEAVNSAGSDLGVSLKARQDARVSKVSTVEHESLLSSLDQVGGDEIPVEGEPRRPASASPHPARFECRDVSKAVAEQGELTSPKFLTQQ
jgi:hypothetical protein